MSRSGIRSLGPQAGARILAGAVALLFAAPLIAWFDAPVHRPQDEGMLLVYPELILNGLLPHRDFLASYPPGNFFLLALAYQLFEPSILVERSLGLIYRIALVLGVVALGCRRGALIGAACGIASAVILHPLRLEAFSWIGGLALVVWGTVALRSQRPLLAGALMGLALSFRLDLALAIAMVAAANVWFFRHDQGWRALWPLGMGLGSTLLPLCLYFIVISPQNATQDLLVGPVLLTGPARRLPFSSLGTNSLRLLLLLGIGIVSAALAARHTRNWTDSERVDALATAGLCAGLVPQALQRMDADHLIYACAIAGSLLPASLDRLLEQRMDRVPALLLGSFVIVTTIGTPTMQLISTSLNHLISRPPIVFIQRDERRLPARNSHEISAFFDIGTALAHQSTPGERLFIGPTDLSRTNYCDLHLYFLFPELVPASYFLELNPRSANRDGTRLTRDLETADWLLLSREWDAWNEPNASSEYGDSRPNQVVRRRFEQVVQHGVWILYRRREPQ